MYVNPLVASNRRGLWLMQLNSIAVENLFNYWSLENVCSYVRASVYLNVRALYWTQCILWIFDCCFPRLFLHFFLFFHKLLPSSLLRLIEIVRDLRSSRYKTGIEGDSWPWQLGQTSGIYTRLHRVCSWFGQCLAFSSSSVSQWWR